MKLIFRYSQRIGEADYILKNKKNPPQKGRKKKDLKKGFDRLKEKVIRDNRKIRQILSDFELAVPKKVEVITTDSYNSETSFTYTGLRKTTPVILFKQGKFSSEKDVQSFFHELLHAVFDIQKMDKLKIRILNSKDRLLNHYFEEAIVKIISRKLKEKSFDRTFYKSSNESPLENYLHKTLSKKNPWENLKKIKTSKLRKLVAHFIFKESMEKFFKKKSGYFIGKAKKYWFDYSNSILDYSSLVLNLIGKKKMKKGLDELKGKKIIELGCGPGYFLDFLKSLGINAKGIDPRFRKREKIIRKDAKIALREMKGNDIDLIVSVNLFADGIISEKDASEIMMYSHRCLKKKGKIVNVVNFQKVEEGELLKRLGRKEENFDRFKRWWEGLNKKEKEALLDKNKPFFSEKWGKNGFEAKEKIDFAGNYLSVFEKI